MTALADLLVRDPAKKSFAIGLSGATRKRETVLAESMKCDLVCANCHRMRTHRQRCFGCEYCDVPTSQVETAVVL